MTEEIMETKARYRIRVELSTNGIKSFFAEKNITDSELTWVSMRNLIGFPYGFEDIKNCEKYIDNHIEYLRDKTIKHIEYPYIKVESECTIFNNNNNKELIKGLNDLATQHETNGDSRLISLCHLLVNFIEKK